MDAFVSPLHELGSFEELERASAEDGHGALGNRLYGCTKTTYDVRMEQWQGYACHCYF